VPFAESMNIPIVGTIVKMLCRLSLFQHTPTSACYASLFSKCTDQGLQHASQDEQDLNRVLSQGKT